MSIAFFPGKFQPVHLGHIITIMDFYHKFEKIIIGITEDGPDFLSMEERINIFQRIFKHLPKIMIVEVKGKITNSKDLSRLPKFDICLSGNRSVIKTLNELGFNTIYTKRTEGPGFSGRAIRSLVEN